MRIFLCLSLLLVISTMWSNAARAERPVIGVDPVHPQWRSPAEQQVLLSQLEAARVEAIRVSLLPESIDFIRAASGRGLKIVLTIPVDAVAMAPAGTALRKGDEAWGVFSLPPLSQIDPELFRAFVAPLFERLDALGIRLSALQLGNEINWLPFNGDFPFPGTRQSFDLDDLQSAETVAGQIARGFDVYIRLVEVARALRDGSVNNRTTPIVASGLTEPDRSYFRTGPWDFVTIEATLAHMRARGLDTLVDAYAIHVYPELGQSARRRALRVQHLLSSCRPPERGKPCWLTEWGVMNHDMSCPPDEAKRLRLLIQTRRSFLPYIDQGSIVGLIYFSWSYGPWGIYRCGALTAAGARALEPFD